MKSMGVLLADALKIPRGFFYSRNHTWTHLERSGNARVGLDDLLLHITGPVGINILRNPGEWIKKGEILAEISRDGKKLQIASPLSGEIQGVNPGPDNRHAIQDDPYGAGWICTVRPSRWHEETASFYLADEAVEWIRRELAKLRDFVVTASRSYSAEPGMVVLQEGGELPDHPLAEMPGEVWQDFQKAFLDRMD